ncbi:MAG: hypothetical protein AAFN94_08115 [Pseudomonadota bacterium]
MEFERIDIALQPTLRAAAEALARKRDVTLGHLVRQALEDELKRAVPKTRTCADEGLVARLQRLLAGDFAAATGWDDLDRALAAKGFAVQPAGGGLVVVDAGGKRMCKSSELGFGYARLVRRFHAAMPGHPHRMQHLLEDDPEDFEVIKPF